MAGANVTLRADNSTGRVSPFKRCDRGSRPRRPTNMKLITVVILAALVFAVIHYVQVSAACEKTGGVLVRGAFDFVCVDKR